MYSFRLMPINEVGGAIIPAQIAEKVQNKLFPEIEKKLQKIHNPSGTYLIYPSKKMWELKEDEDPYRTRYVHPRHVFEDRRIFFTGTLFLEFYVDETHPAYKYIPNFDGFLPLICGIVDLSWEISKECSTEEIDDLITDKDLTALLLSPLCQFRICEISLSRIGNGEDSSSSEVAEKTFKFPYEINGEDYPDTIFEVYFSHKVAKKHLAKLDDVLSKYMQQQATCDEGDAAVHYIGEAECAEDDDHVAQIHIDFGGSDPEMILDVLDVLSKNVRRIAKVVVD